MARYTSDDNRSMQLNPENDRYWSSRGYYDDDDDDESSSFNLKEWEKEKDKEYEELKKTVDNIAINAFNKKVIVKRECDSWHPVFNNTEMFFEKVLKEKDSLNIVSGVTVKTESFKRFFIENLASKKSNNNSRYCSFDFVEDLFKGGLGNLSKDVQRNYVYFSRVIFSDSYVIFEINTSDQGYTRYNYSNSSYSWSWGYNSCSLRKTRPEVVYENFEDIFSCYQSV